MQNVTTNLVASATAKSPKESPKILPVIILTYIEAPTHPKRNGTKNISQKSFKNLVGVAFHQIAWETNPKINEHRYVEMLYLAKYDAKRITSPIAKIHKSFKTASFFVQQSISLKIKPSNPNTTPNPTPAII